jgi:hypothetical protein
MNLGGLIIISYAFKLALLEVLLTYWFHHKTRLQYQEFIFFGNISVKVVRFSSEKS